MPLLRVGQLGGDGRHEVVGRGGEEAAGLGIRAYQFRSDDIDLRPLEMDTTGR